MPKGSFLAVILFIFRISNMTESIPCHIKFADDVNLWASNCNPMIVASDVWNKKWRMNLSKEKTKIICFSERTYQIVSVKMDDYAVGQVVEKIYLGVILGEKLHFLEHISYACRKALKALNKISLFHSINKWP